MRAPQVSSRTRERTNPHPRPQAQLAVSRTVWLAEPRAPPLPRASDLSHPSGSPPTQPRAQATSRLSRRSLRVCSERLSCSTTWPGSRGRSPIVSLPVAAGPCALPPASPSQRASLPVSSRMASRCAPRVSFCCTTVSRSCSTAARSSSSGLSAPPCMGIAGHGAPGLNVIFRYIREDVSG
uniref:Uncharacterized protein n=1 Tax=Mustela putorius furo TaxID=9669 RepID=M3YYP7_MUSPF